MPAPKSAAGLSLGDRGSRSQHWPHRDDRGNLSAFTSREVQRCTSNGSITWF
jgi:hypothetical protein